MRSFAIGASLCALAATPALADETCARGEDVRVIEVLTPGQVGAACDLRYTRDGGSNVSVPYHADNAADFCSERARALIASLVDAGFVCTQKASAPALREVQEREFDIEEILADAQADPQADEPQTRLAVAAPPGMAQESAPAEASAPSSLEPVLEQPALTQAPGAAAEQEVITPAFAQRGPTALAPAALSAEGAADLKRHALPVGRLVGASPDEPPLSDGLAVQQEPASIEPVQALSQPAQENAATKPAAGEIQASTPMKTRPAPDLIRAVLAAQAAAWNDGDLDDFMAGYWKSPNLRFVSGASVTKGWEPTLKRYRELYGTGAALGRLSFDNIEVQMLNTDVAVVVGRYNLVRADARDSGAFTLVMQRFDGLWRIVHDHSVGDAPAAPALTATASQ